MLNTSEEENKPAIFEFMKWMSYGEEGILKNLEIRKQLENPVPYIHLPITQTSSIRNEIEASDVLPNGLKNF